MVRNKYHSFYSQTVNGYFLIVRDMLWFAVCITYSSYTTTGYYLSGRDMLLCVVSMSHPN